MIYLDFLWVAFVYIWGFLLVPADKAGQEKTRSFLVKIFCSWSIHMRSQRTLIHQYPGFLCNSVFCVHKNFFINKTIFFPLFVFSYSYDNVIHHHFYLLLPPLVLVSFCPVFLPFNYLLHLSFKSHTMSVCSIIFIVWQQSLGHIHIPYCCITVSTLSCHKVPLWMLNFWLCSDKERDSHSFHDIQG